MHADMRSFSKFCLIWDLLLAPWFGEQNALHSSDFTTGETSESFDHLLNSKTPTDAIISLNRHRKELERRDIRYLQRFKDDANNDYPYRSHWQPYTAYLAFIGCIFLVVVANGAALWKTFRVKPFLSGYLAVSQSSFTVCR